MTALSTHDTKRGEDVRARLAVLSELPDAWAKLVGGLMTAAPIPDATFGYLLWQTLAGVGFIARERLHDYVVKAMREAAVNTTWIDPDESFEQIVHGAVDAAYDLPQVHDPLAEFIERITPFGWSNSLSQKLVQLTMPGIPDVYQGTERWEDSLVDPDNRRPVDLDALQSMLDAMDGSLDPPPIDRTGRAKLWVTSRALRLRRDWPDLFDRYTPVEAIGSAAKHAVAFDRGGVIALATRLPVQLERGGGWRDTTIDLAGAATDVITGRSFRAEVELGDVLSAYPVALLVR
jgi:(1->4)-alpha-D-glucan 1-alpha-D-glucosylmutase